jgi:predicted Zn-dependent protease
MPWGKVMKQLYFFVVSVLILFTVNLPAQNGQEYHLSMLGHYALMQKKPQDSHDYYQQLLASGSSPYMYSGYIRFLFASNQFTDIVSLLPQLEKPFENDLDMQLIFAQSLAGAGRQNVANDRFIQLQQKYKTHAELTYMAAQAHSVNNPKKSIQVIDEFLNSTPFQPRNCLFYFLKSQHYMALNDKKEAITQAKKSLDICPQFDKGWLLLGMLQEQEGKVKEAITGYSNFLELAGPNKEIEQQISALTLKLRFNKTNSGTKENSFLTDALTWYENKQYAKALTAINNSLKQDPSDQESRLLKINILSASNHVDAAATLLQTWMMEEPSNDTWFKALHLLYRAGLSKDRALSIFHAVEKQHPQELLVALYLADTYTRARLFSAAVDYHKKALSLTTDPLLKTKIAYNMGTIHHTTNDIAAMKQALEEGIQHGALFPPLYNLLAYYYATYGRDTRRAQTYISQALKDDAKNPHFLDTQAVIWYKQREYAKAEKILKKLAAREPKDHFIQLHLAKTEHKLGKQKQSMHTLNKALKYAHTDNERTTCKKLLRMFETT